METAAFVALGLCLTLTCVSAGCAVLASRRSKEATKRLLTSSLRVELDEIHDAIGKHSALLKKINIRTYQRERREAEAAEESGDEPTSDVKQKLRRKIGLAAARVKELP